MRQQTRKLFVVLIILLGGADLTAGELVLAGVYQGENLYVQNPYVEGSNHFCTQQVYLNDKLIKSNPKTSAYMIDLSGLRQDQLVIIKIIHYDGCEPKVINPQVIRRKAEFEFISVRLDADKFKWTAEGEMPRSRYFIEQYINGRWIIKKAVDAKGTYTSNEYSYTPTIGSGENKMRVKALLPRGEVVYSEAANFTSDKPPVTFSPSRVTDKIFLSREAEYSVIDAYGNIISEGKGEVIDCDQLTTGLYYLSLENKTEKFIKK